METLTLAAKSRAESGTVKAQELRSAGLIPGIVYGRKQEPLKVAVDAKTFAKMLQSAGESTLIDLQVEGAKAPLKTLVQDVQRDPISDLLTHVDFRAVSMDEKLKVKIPFNFVGESAAVKGLGGTLVKNVEMVEVLCLPSALVNHIDVDISSLATFEDKIRVSAVKLPEGMEVTAKTDEVVVLVAPPRTDEEMAKLDAAVEADASKVEVIKKVKEEEGAEGAEGADAAKGDAKPAAAAPAKK